MMIRIKSLAVGFMLTSVWAVQAQDTQTNSAPKEGYTFTVVKEMKATPVKNQASSGTCWCYSGISYLESELLRMGKPEYDLSEMWVVRHCYTAKAEKYVRLHGALNFAGGGSFEDVFWAIRTFGIVPQDVYQGLNYGSDRNVHGELDGVAKAYVNVIAKENRVTTAWLAGFNGIMDAYLGVVPTKFTYGGKEYTPHSFSSSLGLNLDDYVSLTSFTHHPYYKKFILEIPDNWIWGEYMNIRIDEMVETVNNALNNGYTVLWAADVSERGFAYRKGVAVVPETDIKQMTGSDQAHWVGLSDKEREERMMRFDEVVPEKTVSQESRQKEFDNFQTTDDHGMHIVGLAKDQSGKTFYKVKNSWGTTDSKYDGYFYVSEAFFRLKTIDITVHKDALPKSLAKKIL